MKFSVNSGDNYKIDLNQTKVISASVNSTGLNLFNSDSNSLDNNRSNSIVKGFNTTNINVGEANTNHEYSITIEVEKVNEVIDNNILAKTPSLNTTVKEPNTIVIDNINSNVELINRITDVPLEHYNEMIMTYVTGKKFVVAGGNVDISLDAPTIINDDGSIQFGSIIIEAEMQTYHDCLVQLPLDIVNALTFIEIGNLPAPLIFDIDTYTLKGYVNFTSAKNIQFKFINNVVIGCTIKPVMKSNVRNNKR